MVHEDKITVEDAMNFSDNKDEFLLCLKDLKKCRTPPERRTHLALKEGKCTSLCNHPYSC